MMTCHNLIPSHRRRARRRHVRIRRWIAAGTMYAAAMLALGAVCRLTAGGPEPAVADELAKLSHVMKTTNQSMAELSRQLGEAQATLNLSRAIGSEPDWSQLLSLLAQSLGQDVVLNSCQLEPAPASAVRAGQAVKAAAAGVGTGGVSAATAEASSACRPVRYRLRISGRGRSQAAVSEFVLRLEQTKLFDQVLPPKTNRETFLRKDAIAFWVECVLSETPQP
jgi:Tfp pilus assembly protein PilN